MCHSFGSSLFQTNRSAQTKHPGFVLRKHLETCSEISCGRISRLQSAVWVCVDQSSRRTETADILHARSFWEFIHTVVAYDLWSFPELVIPELESQSDTSQTDSNEDDNEHSTDVGNRNTVRLVLGLLALSRHVIFLPPLLLQLLQMSLVEQQEDSMTRRIIESNQVEKDFNWNLSRIVELILQRRALLNSDSVRLPRELFAHHL